MRSNRYDMDMCVCTCWTGIQCKDGINECLSNPCLNAGLCVDGVNEYRCVCLTGYTGVNCQTQVSPCTSAPCLNNGKTELLLFHKRNSSFS